MGNRKPTKPLTPLEEKELDSLVHHSKYCVAKGAGGLSGHKAKRLNTLLKRKYNAENSALIEKYYDKDAD